MGGGVIGVERGEKIENLVKICCIFSICCIFYLQSVREMQTAYHISHIISMLFWYIFISFKKT